MKSFIAPITVLKSGICRDLAAVVRGTVSEIESLAGRRAVLQLPGAAS
jgi:hypothetical protein